MRNKYTYKDFETGKPKWTKGRFREWTEPTGLLNVRYAVIDRGASTLFIPEYCLTPDSKRSMEYEMKCRQVPARLFEELPKLKKPSKEYKHLFGIVETKKGRTGFFLVNAPDRNVDREMLKEMFAEANEEGIDRPLNIYCATCSYSGHGINIIQVEWNG